MLRRHLFQLAGAAGLVLGWGLIAAACGGSSTNSNPGSSSGNTATASSSGGGSTSNANSELPQAGPGLSAYHLLDAAGYAAALGEPVTGIEDDGVFPQQYVCEIGKARVLTSTSGAILTLLLVTADSAESAQGAYQTYSSSSFGNGTTPTPIAGAGDKAAYFGGTAVVLKGSQVLQIQAQAGPDAQARLDSIKSNGGDPTAAGAEIYLTSQKIAPALAHKMAGTPCNGPALGVPAGALPPCTTKASDIEAAIGITGVMVTPVLSDKPPYQQCNYGLGAEGTVSVYTVTKEQLTASIVGKTASELFAAAQDSATRTRPGETAQFRTYAHGHYKGFGSTSPKRGLDTTVYFNAGASARDLGGGAGHAVAYMRQDGGVIEVILTILESSSSPMIKLEHCVGLMKLLHDDTLPSHVSEPDYTKTLNDDIDLCQAAVAIQALLP